MKRKTKVYIYNTIAIALLLCAIAYLITRLCHFGNVEYTDNAYVHQQITPVNSRVQGFITEIRFNEYQTVHAGDTLFLIEDTQYKLQVAQAEAALATAQAGHSGAVTGVTTVENNIAVNDAAIAEAKAQMDNAQREDERHERLLSRHAVTQQQYDNVHTAYIAAKSRHEGLLRTKKSTQSVRNEQNNRVDQSHAAIKVAQAQLDLARLHLSYTAILAPCDGVMGKKNINVGQLVQPGQTLVDIVDSSDKWIVANYREKQLRNIAIGDSVKIKVDALPKCHFSGKVVAISDATGSAVSLIPTDNATGNFVKVEQRIPVRIAIDSVGCPYWDRLRAGMSAECEIKY